MIITLQTDEQTLIRSSCFCLLVLFLVGGGSRGVAVEDYSCGVQGLGVFVGGRISGARGGLTCGVIISMPRVDNDELALLLPSSRFHFRAFLVRTSSEEPCM